MRIFSTASTTIRALPFCPSATCKKEYFEFTSGILRAFADPKHFDNITFLYEDVMRYNAILAAACSDGSLAQKAIHAGAGTKCTDFCVFDPPLLDFRMAEPLSQQSVDLAAEQLAAQLALHAARRPGGQPGR